MTVNVARKVKKNMCPLSRENEVAHTTEIVCSICFDGIEFAAKLGPVFQTILFYQNKDKFLSFFFWMIAYLGP